MTPLEIAATMGLLRGQWWNTLCAFGATPGSRPFATNGAFILLGDENPIYSECEVPEHIRATIRTEMGKSKEFPRTQIQFRGVPSGAILCSSCSGTGKHNICCLDGIAECNHTACAACRGSGDYYPGGVWSINLIDDVWVDAYFLRLILDHLGTTCPAMGFPGFPGAFVFSHLGRDALLMPLGGRSGRVVELERQS